MEKQFRQAQDAAVALNSSGLRLGIWVFPSKLHQRPPPLQTIPWDCEPQEEVELSTLSSASSSSASSSASSWSTDSTPAGPPPSRATSPSTAPVIKHMTGLRALTLLAVLTLLAILNVLLAAFCLKAQLATMDTVGRLAHQEATQVSNSGGLLGAGSMGGGTEGFAQDLD
ncbi:hypothetical protein B0H16DRAFT_1726914 [Mycena metata]|uniref:Uncharacterized protein n=1 Tax=Mycena metata TaxID=1033252 RepID=A0AAD7N4L9_9AGAR|nr:hypothetical protein B0H16DRAFT_1726914 [Mycena metata]